ELPALCEALSTVVNEIERDTEQFPNISRQIGNTFDRIAIVFGKLKLPGATDEEPVAFVRKKKEEPSEENPVKQGPRKTTGDPALKETARKKLLVCGIANPEKAWEIIERNLGYEIAHKLWPTERPVQCAVSKIGEECYSDSNMMYKKSKVVRDYVLVCFDNFDQKTGTALPSIKNSEDERHSFKLQQRLVAELPIIENVLSHWARGHSKLTNEAIALVVEQLSSKLNFGKCIWGERGGIEGEVTVSIQRQWDRMIESGNITPVEIDEEMIGRNIRPEYEGNMDIAEQELAMAYQHELWPTEREVQRALSRIRYEENEGEFPDNAVAIRGSMLRKVRETGIEPVYNWAVPQEAPRDQFDMLNFVNKLEEEYGLLRLMLGRFYRLGKPFLRNDDHGVIYKEVCEKVWGRGPYKGTGGRDHDFHIFVCRLWEQIKEGRVPTPDFSNENAAKTAQLTFADTQQVEPSTAPKGKMHQQEKKVGQHPKQQVRTTTASVPTIPVVAPEKMKEIGPAVDMLSVRKIDSADDYEACLNAVKDVFTADTVRVLATSIAKRLRSNGNENSVRLTDAERTEVSLVRTRDFDMRFLQIIETVVGVSVDEIASQNSIDSVSDVVMHFQRQRDKSAAEIANCVIARLEQEEESFQDSLGDTSALLSEPPSMQGSISAVLDGTLEIPHLSNGELERIARGVLVQGREEVNFPICPQEREIVRRFMHMQQYFQIQRIDDIEERLRTVEDTGKLTAITDALNRECHANIPFRQQGQVAHLMEELALEELEKRERVEVTPEHESRKLLLRREPIGNERIQSVITWVKNWPELSRTAGAKRQELHHFCEGLVEDLTEYLERDGKFVTYDSALQAVEFLEQLLEANVFTVYGVGEDSERMRINDFECFQAMQRKFRIGGPNVQIGPDADENNILLTLERMRALKKDLIKLEKETDESIEADTQLQKEQRKLDESNQEEKKALALLGGDDTASSAEALDETALRENITHFLSVLRYLNEQSNDYLVMHSEESQVSAESERLGELLQTLAGKMATAMTSELMEEMQEASAKKLSCDTTITELREKLEDIHSSAQDIDPQVASAAYAKVLQAALEVWNSAFSETELTELDTLEEDSSDESIQNRADQLVDRCQTFIGQRDRSELLDKLDEIRGDIVSHQNEIKELQEKSGQRTIREQMLNDVREQLAALLKGLEQLALKPLTHD
ncbi:MAG: hypothetical protein QF793_01905, partial [Candidatus Peribacteraceae bacterium]|nr:hypothetical protein [Candidatus Peribacteraceae bacterium]